MSNNPVSLNGVFNEYITLCADESVEVGKLCCMTTNYTVTRCCEDAAPVGLVTAINDGLATIQIKGYVEYPSSGGIILGYNPIIADANGGITAEENSYTPKRLVVMLNHATHTVGFFL